jgi:dimethylaniline monooxygenase (N-oxide forming)
MEKAIDAFQKNLRDLAPLGFNNRHKSSMARSVLVNEGSWRKFIHDAAGTGVNEYLGFGWQGWSYWLRERKFCGLLMTGVDGPHVYRLFPSREGGPKRWKGAREAIEKVNLEVDEFVAREKSKQEAGK